MVSVSFPTSSSPGTWPGEGQGRLINCRAKKEGDLTYWRSCAGLASFVTMPSLPIRGVMPSGVFVYVVAGSTLYRVAQNGSIEVFSGTVHGSGRVFMARNNEIEPSIVIVSSAAVQRVEGMTVRVYEDGNLPAIVASVARVGGYLVFVTEAGDIWATDLNSLTVNALSFARAESDPDGLVRGISSGGVFYAMGGSTIEAWQDVGSTPFPLQRVTTVIPVGLLSAGAVAGVEGEWDNPPIFVAADHTVRVLNGLQTQIISTPDLQRLIEKADPATLQACVYSAGGDTFWCLSSPDWTWEYAVQDGTWAERESHEIDRWRVAFTCRQWGDWIAADYATGALYRIDASLRQEAGMPLTFGADSAPTKAFPARSAISAAVFEFTLGHGNAAFVGDPTREAPRAMLSWSRDGGAHWDGPLHRSLGKQGQFVGPVRVNRLGLASHHGIRLRFRVSDPVPVSFMGATIEGEDRSS